MALENIRKSRRVTVGGVAMGGGAPVTVQSMLSAPAADVEGNVAQARALAAAGCQLIRVSVPKPVDVRLVKNLKAAVSVPVVADIHFDYEIALAAVEAGVDKIRLNPGNIGGPGPVRQVAAACKRAGVPIRIGVNGGSLEQPLLEKYGGPMPDALVESALNHAALLEGNDFHDIVLSLKSSHVPTMVAAYKKLAALCDYPLHLGVTEAGTYRAGLVKNAMGIGALLMEGIGDTLRVSLTDDPLREVEAGFHILRAAGLPVEGPEIIACPTCGRTNIPVAQLATELEERLKGCKKPIRVAVMGCVVNGLGEGREADIGIAGGRGSAVLFVRGRRVRTLRGHYIDELLAEIDKL